MTLQSFCTNHHNVAYSLNYHGNMELALRENLDQEAMQELCSEILADNEVKTLSVGNVSFSEDIFALICQLLINPKCTIKELLFTPGDMMPGETLNKDIAVMLADVLCNPKNKIDYLKISRLIPRDQIDEVLDIIGKAIINDNSKIKKLSLWANQINDISIQRFASIISTNKAKLKVLDIQMNTNIVQGETLDSLSSVIKTHVLKELNICEDIIYDDIHSKQFFLSLRDPNCWLETLTFNGVTVSDSAMNILAEHVAKPGCRLKHLSLQHCNISETAINWLLQSLASNSATLESLDLSFITLTDHNCEVLAKVLSSDKFTLKKLNLCYCGITRDNMLLLNESLLENKYLEDITFWGNVSNLQDRENNNDPSLKQSILDNLQNFYFTLLLYRKGLPLNIEGIDGINENFKQIIENVQTYFNLVRVVQNILLRNKSLVMEEKVLDKSIVMQKIISFIGNIGDINRNNMEKLMMPAVVELKNKRASGHPHCFERFLPDIMFNMFKEKATNEAKSEACKAYQRMAIVPKRRRSS